MTLVQHDGREVPKLPIGRVHLRGGSYTGLIRWDWAGKTHRPEDVVSYTVAWSYLSPAPAFGAGVAGEYGGAIGDPTRVDPSSLTRGAAPRVTRASVLDYARRAVLETRAATHGNLEESFTELACLWSVRLGVEITAAQVSILLVDLKTVRAWHNPGHADNWDDMAGYAACGGEVSGAVRA